MTFKTLFRLAVGCMLATVLQPTFVVAQQGTSAGTEVKSDLALKLLAEANKCLSLTGFEEALERYQEVLRLYPNNLEAKANSGTCLAAMGRPEEALSLFQQVGKSGFASEALKEAVTSSALELPAFNFSPEEKALFETVSVRVDAADEARKQSKIAFDSLRHSLFDCIVRLEGLKRRVPDYTPLYRQLGRAYELSGNVKAVKEYAEYLTRFRGLDVPFRTTQSEVLVKLELLLGHNGTIEEPLPEVLLFAVAGGDRKCMKGDYHQVNINGGIPIQFSSPRPGAIIKEAKANTRIHTDQSTPFNDTLTVECSETTYYVVTAYARFLGHSLHPSFAIGVTVDGKPTGLGAGGDCGPGGYNMLCQGVVKLGPGRHDLRLMGSMPNGKGLSATNPYEITEYRLELDPVYVQPD